MRGRIYSIIVDVLFLVILAGLAYLQILRWPLYHDLSRKNHIRLIPMPGLRGTIYDRNGLAIVDNRLSFDVVIIPQEVENVDTTYGRLSRALGISRSRIESIVKKDYTAPFAPITIAGDVDKDLAFRLEEKKQELPGVLVLPRTLRWYIYGERTSHLIGYLSLINKEELERLGDYGYSISDLVGRDGIERAYDKYLKGEDGGTQLEVDATGRLVKILGSKNQKKGTDITLTVDVKLQAYAADCLEGVKGSVVIMDPRNGEILAMASSPSFDSNIFVERGKGEQAAGYMKSGSHPMLNRAINGQYPAGSIFKIIMSDAGLETKTITEHSTFVCNGKFFLGRAEFDCWKEGGHGPQDLRDAITHSCNVYFYNLGHKLGPNVISEYSQKFGLGKPTGIDIAGESSGLVPSPAWKKAKRGQNWYEGETINYAIGQGDLLVTPLQMVEVVSVFATEGSAPRPHIIKKIGNADVQAPKPKTIPVSKAAIETIKSAMVNAVASNTGTGQRARIEGIKVAAKTGTAQTTNGEPHAWFLGFAPAGDPKIAFVVMVEHGGHGGVTAADIAKKILDFAKDNTEVFK
ncbi:MAG: penicillin-binding protein 2 [Candidatus Omnitrophica bacterium]|nr:penicillin-binding protein 2 [Candidatus Omnitrophota bacterium]